MTLEISGDRLKGAPFVPAHSSGARMASPSLIVLHDTADRAQPKDTVRWFASKECTVSAHFVVERDGSITQMVECDQKAFHAGKSAFKGRASCNNFAIGIEIDNPGKLDKNGRAWFHKKGEAGYTDIQAKATKEHGAGYWMPYTDAQIKTVIHLCRALIKAYPSVTDIATHWIISPGRKIDTNPLFPLDEVRAAVFKPGRTKPIAPPAAEVAAPVAPAVDVPLVAKDVLAVSRKAKTLSRFKAAMHSIWLSLGIGSFLEWLGLAKGTMDQVAELVEQHAVVLLITGAILIVLVVKYVLSLMAEDVNEGRYVPSGERGA
jgi:N-acetylmuramoyl-L-alanine amidase